MPDAITPFVAGVVPYTVEEHSFSELEKSKSFGHEDGPPRLHRAAESGGEVYKENSDEGDEEGQATLLVLCWYTIVSDTSEVVIAQVRLVVQSHSAGPRLARVAGSLTTDSIGHGKRLSLQCIWRCSFYGL